MKNFQLVGIADEVRFGQGGLLIKNNGTQFVVRNSDDTDYVEILSKYPTTNDSVATKKYVDDNIGGGGYTSPITTKGEIFIGSDTGTDSTLSVGANNFVLVPDSSVSGGLKWVSLATHPEIISINSSVSTNTTNIGTNTGNISTNTTNIGTNTGDITIIENDILGINTVLSDHETRITTLEGASIPALVKGSLLTNNGTSNIALGVGSDTQILSADSSEPSGLKWINQPSGGGSGASKVWITPTAINSNTNQSSILNVANSNLVVASDGTPLELSLIMSGLDSYVGGQRTSAGEVKGIIYLYRDFTNLVASYQISGYSDSAGSQFFYPAGGVKFYHLNPPVGSVTYNLKWASTSTAEFIFISGCKLMARQLNVQP